MIYLLEDDTNIRELIIYTLKSQNIESIGFAKPSLFFDKFNNNNCELIILDIMLPEESGLEVLKKLKNNINTRDIPVILLTSKSTEYDKVIGLNSGADDYLTKPFGMMELLARINAVLRRTNKVNEQVLKYFDLLLDINKHIVYVDDDKVELTLKEFMLLEMMLKNIGQVFTREYLLDTVWGYEFIGENRTVDVHIRTLRKKIGKCASYIKTVHGVGYKIDKEND